MLKAGKWGIALALALIMGFSLLIPSAFAQSVKADHQQSVKIATVTTVPQVATNVQQVTEKLNATRRGHGFRGGFFRRGGFRRGGFRRGRFFRHHRFFRHRRFFRHSRFFGGFGDFDDFGGCGFGCGCW